jgi:transposase-like protein
MKNMEITCPHCGNNEHIKKNGHYRGEQVYKCSKCKKTFRLSTEDKRIKHPSMLRKLAIISYLNGMSLRGIQETLNTCFNAKLAFCVINNWIKNANNLLEEENKRRKEENPITGEKTIIPIVEMDELYAYVKKNPKIKKQEDHITTNEYGLLWIGSEMKLLHLK